LEKVEILKKCDMFRTLNSAQLQVIAKMSTPVEFEPGETIFRQDKILDKLYVIEEGLVAIILEVGPLAQRQVQAASNFDVVGWSAMIEPHISTAAAKALEKTKALAFNGQELHNLCLTKPEIGCRVSRGVARIVAVRLRHAFSQLLGVTSSEQ
jgi:CRP-like cAMP-binding protein